MFDDMPYDQATRIVGDAMAAKGYVAINIDKSRDGTWYVSGKMEKMSNKRVIVATGDTWRKCFEEAMKILEDKMKTRTVTENTEITLDGKPWILEKGDKIQIMEGPVDLSRSTNFTLKNLSGTPAALEYMKKNNITPTNLQQTPQFKFPLGAMLDAKWVGPDDVPEEGETVAETVVGYGLHSGTFVSGHDPRYKGMPTYITSQPNDPDTIDGYDPINDCEREMLMGGVDESVVAKLMPPPAIETTDAAQSTCKVCGKKFLGRSERARCQDCMASQHDAAERATGVQ